MAKIDYIVVHHFGGLGNDRYASTKHLTVQHVDNAHRSRWADFKSSLGYWVGYNFIITPDGKITQTRAIGEETASVRGYNSRTINIALAGNFNHKFNKQMVDTPTNEQNASLYRLIAVIFDRNFAQSGVKVKEGTQFNLVGYRVVPHYYFSRTDCYGTGLSTSWARGYAVSYLAVKSILPKSFIAIYTSFMADILRNSLEPRLGAQHEERECESYV